jgi:hypothetical protein
MSMKLVAVCRVRNEVAIIEAFVRHHCAHFHKLIVLDDGSCDGTLGILRSMQTAGLPLVVLWDESLVYDQSRYVTRLLHMAVNQFGADWVMPLHADEFIEPQNGVKLAERLSAIEPQLLALPWRDFVCSEQNGFNSETNPVIRLRLSLPLRWDNAKVMITAHLVTNGAQLSQGNHALLTDSEVLLGTPLSEVHICHYPVRDPVQYAGKVAIGFLKYSASAAWNRDQGFQYIEPFAALLEGGMEAIRQRMIRDSQQYSMKTPRDDPKPQEAPLKYEGGPLTVSSSPQPLLSNVLHYAKSLAQEYAAAVTRHQALTTEIEAWKNKQTIADERTRALTEDNAALEKRAARLELELLAAREQIFVQSERLASRTYRLIDLINRRLTKAGLAPKVGADFIFWLLRFK